MNGQTAKRIRKHVRARNPGLLYLLREEYGEEVFQEDQFHLYKKAKRLYKKRPFLQNSLIKQGVNVIKEELKKEKLNARVSNEQRVDDGQS